MNEDRARHRRSLRFVRFLKTQRRQLVTAAQTFYRDEGHGPVIGRVVDLMGGETFEHSDEILELNYMTQVILHQQVMTDDRLVEIAVHVKRYDPSREFVCVAQYEDGSYDTAKVNPNHHPSVG